jgi:hypothetical protein
MIGVPGTGLGGVFYALLVVWMAVREVGLAARGAGDPKRWPKIAWLAALLAAIILVLATEGWLLRLVLDALSAPADPISAARPDTSAEEISQIAVMGAIAPALAIAPFIVLAAIVAAIHVARLTVRPNPIPLPGETTEARLGAFAPSSQEASNSDPVRLTETRPAQLVRDRAA